MKYMFYEVILNHTYRYILFEELTTFIISKHQHYSV